MISILIFLSLIFSISSMEYNLINGHIKDIPQLSKGINYYFYIEASEPQRLNIELYMDSSDNMPFDNIYINEYSSRDGDYISHDFHNVYLLLDEDGTSFISETYSVRSSSTKFVSVQIFPDYDVYNFKILIDVSSTSIVTKILVATLIPLFVCVICCVLVFKMLRKKPVSDLDKQNNKFITSTQADSSSAQPKSHSAQPKSASAQLDYSPVQPEYAPPQPTQSEYGPSQTQCAPAQPPYSPAQPIYTPEQPQYYPPQPQYNQIPLQYNQQLLPLG